MPTLKVNKVFAGSGIEAQTRASFMYRRKETGGVDMDSQGIAGKRYVVAVDNLTYMLLLSEAGPATWSPDDAGELLDVGSSGNSCGGVIRGYTGASGNEGGAIRIDQGLATNQISPTAGLDSDLYESQYIVETDYRLGRVKPQNTHTEQAVNFIDDDNVATYYLTTSPYVYNNPSTLTLGASTGAGPADGGKQVFEGPRGSVLLFRLHASTELQYSNYLFTQIGSSETTDSASNVFGFKNGDSRLSGRTTYYIDTTVRVFGANTGFRMDVPVRYVKIE